MDWYIPITIVPGVGMFILSTTSQMMNLSIEIGQLVKECKDNFQHHIAALKIAQLTRLTRATTLLYTAAASFVLSGFMGVIHQNGNWSMWILTAGVASTFLALGLLVNYSYHAISIRRKQHQHSHKTILNGNT